MNDSGSDREWTFLNRKGDEEVRLGVYIFLNEVTVLPVYSSAHKVYYVWASDFDHIIDNSVLFAVGR